MKWIVRFKAVRNWVQLVLVEITHWTSICSVLSVFRFSLRQIWVLGRFFYVYGKENLSGAMSRYCMMRLLSFCLFDCPIAVFFSFFYACFSGQKGMVGVFWCTINGMDYEINSSTGLGLVFRGSVCLVLFVFLSLRDPVLVFGRFFYVVGKRIYQWQCHTICVFYKEI